MEKNVTCPNCKTVFELEDSLLKEFTLEIRKDLCQEFLKKEIEFSERLERVRVEVRTQTQQETNLTLKTKDKILTDLRDQLTKIRQKLDNSSQQMTGEIQELELEDILSTTFITDQVWPVAKGVKGADCMQQIMQNGVKIGTILFESKNVKTFSEQWIPKLKKDNLDSKCDINVIVTSAMPSDMKTKFGVKDGVWICLFEEDIIKLLVTTLRFSLMKLHEVTNTYCDGAAKADKLWKYVNSQEFSNLMESVLNGYANLEQSFRDEHKRHIANLKLRELNLKTMLESTLELFTTMKGISPEIPSIKMLEFPQAD